MKLSYLFIALALTVLQLALTFALLLPRRRRAEQRARALLAEYPGAERTSVYLALRGSFGRGRQREIDRKIAEMALQGWLFLRGREAHPLRTIRSWGGGLMLEFLRPEPSKR
ncbi:MAG TPA: hypothetical protein VG963_16105 [Polyangiaceae bacterium]|nr:hypothetical protein [Polyangiaceae bacterium]